MKRGLAFLALLGVASFGLLVYLGYCYRCKKNPSLTEGVGVLVAVIGLGGSARILYLVFIEQPDGLSNEDLTYMFVGAIAMGWCAVKAGVKPFNGPTSNP